MWRMVLEGIEWDGMMIFEADEDLDSFFSRSYSWKELVLL
jgi:hypothetical protein